MSETSPFVSYLEKIRFYKHFLSPFSIAKTLLAYLFWPRNLTPVTINFLITSACNFDCTICNFKKDKYADRISIGDFESFIQKEASYKPTIFFGGGEPFVRKDILTFFEIVKKYKLKCGVNTNGYLMDEQINERLASLPVELIIFSVYGPERIHDAITLRQGSFRKACENIASLCSKKTGKTRVILSCTITQDNLGYLKELPVIARKLGADGVKFEHLYFSDSAEGCQEKIPVVTLINELREIKKKYRGFVMVKPNLSDEEVRAWYCGKFSSKRKCSFVWHSVFVRPDGMIVPCQSLLDYTLGSIAHDRARDIFGNGKIHALRLNLRDRLLAECNRCCKL